MDTFKDNEETPLINDLKTCVVRNFEGEFEPVHQIVPTKSWNSRFGWYWTYSAKSLLTGRSITFTYGDVVRNTKTL